MSWLLSVVLWLLFMWLLRVLLLGLVGFLLDLGRLLLRSWWIMFILCCIILWWVWWKWGCLRGWRCWGCIVRRCKSMGLVILLMRIWLRCLGGRRGRGRCLRRLWGIMGMLWLGRLWWWIFGIWIRGIGRSFWWMKRYVGIGW